MLHGIREKMEKIISGTDVKYVLNLVPGVALAFFIWYVSEIFSQFYREDHYGFQI